MWRLRRQNHQAGSRLVPHVATCDWRDVDVGEGAACLVTRCQFEPLDDGGLGDVGLLAQPLGQIGGLASHRGLYVIPRAFPIDVQVRGPISETSKGVAKQGRRFSRHCTPEPHTTILEATIWAAGSWRRADELFLG